MKGKVYLLGCGKWLDRGEFLRYFEKKVTHTIRKYSLLGKRDRKIAVAFSGGKDSMVLLCILNRIFSQRGYKVAALAVDEGISGYRDRILKEASEFCKENDIELKIFSFKKELGFSLKEKSKKIGGLGMTNCHACSVLKRWILNRKARELGFNVVATAHSLDDEAENIMLNMLKGNPELLAKLGPVSGISRGKAFVQRIKPLYLCSTKEIVLYAKLRKISTPKNPICPLRGTTLRVEIRKWLSHLEADHPEVKNAVVSSFLKIMPDLKAKYKGAEFSKCARCGEAASHRICKACEILEKIR